MGSDSRPVPLFSTLKIPDADPGIIHASYLKPESRPVRKLPPSSSGMRSSSPLAPRSSRVHRKCNTNNPCQLLCNAEPDKGSLDCALDDS
jgi:hypothetical protein